MDIECVRKIVLDLTGFRSNIKFKLIAPQTMLSSIERSFVEEIGRHGLVISPPLQDMSDIKLYRLFGNIEIEVEVGDKFCIEEVK